MVFQTAKMDGRTKIYTIVFVLLWVVFVGSSYIFKENQNDFYTITVVLTLIWAIILFISYWMIPKIEMKGNSIYIINRFSTTRIPINEMKGVKRFERVGVNIKTFGIGGVFGYFGYFNGNDIWYVTNIKKKVKIQMPKVLYVISPEDPEAFINEVHRIRIHVQTEQIKNLR